VNELYVRRPTILVSGPLGGNRELVQLPNLVDARGCTRLSVLTLDVDLDLQLYQ